MPGLSESHMSELRATSKLGLRGEGGYVPQYLSLRFT